MLSASASIGGRSGSGSVRLDDLLGSLLERRDEEVLLAREVVVEERLRDARLAGDPRHRQLGVRVGGEQPCAQLEELTAALVDLKAGVRVWTRGVGGRGPPRGAPSPTQDPMQGGGVSAGGAKPRSMRRPSPVAAILVLTAIALSLPFMLAISHGRLRPGARAAERGAAAARRGAPAARRGADHDPPPPPPAADTGGGGQLPRTGWDATLYFAIGLLLLLAGARLRVLTRIKEVVQRVRRRNTEAALREALEPIRVARMSPPGQDDDWARSTWSRARRPRAVWTGVAEPGD